MRADSDLLIAGGVGHIFARKPSSSPRKPWSPLPIFGAAGLAAAIRPYLATMPTNRHRRSSRPSDVIDGEFSARR